MSTFNRRRFLKKAGVATAAAGTALSLGAPAVHAKKHYEWKMTTTWPPHFPVLGEGADMIARLVDQMSDGRLKIKVYGSGELVPGLQAFDACSQGMVQMGHGASYYWAGREPAAQFFAAVPFGMNGQMMNAWLVGGDGKKLWDEIYAKYNMESHPSGSTGVQMGGWFNKKIESMEDFKGLKMRIPGLGGKVLAKAGGTATLTAGGEIFTNLERGVIDATEWVGPYHDYKMGFYKVAKYYYYPGWHEPGTILECFYNKSAFNKLPSDLQQIVKTAIYHSNLWVLSTFEAKNNFYLQKLINEHNVKLTKFPSPVMDQMRKYAQEVIQEVTEKDAMSKKVYDNFKTFFENSKQWAKISEIPYYNEVV
jgi:TRAP-type mannitol/chloroaromatic compound transport system substrate-binding protein